jgi:histidine triad (HIT) family protein
MEECIFCRIVDKTEPAEIIFENEKVLAFLDNHPQTRGHLLLIPKDHIRWIYDIPDMDKFFLTAQKIIHAIIPVLDADHVTLAAYGHQIAHAHLWIVPQYRRSVGISEFKSKKADEEDQQRLAKILRNALEGGVFV